MFQKIKKIILNSLFVLVANFFVINIAHADIGALIKGELLRTQGAADLPAYTSPVDVVALLIKGALGVVAIIFFLMIIIAGFRWMTAGGNEETVTKARKNISNAIIGLLVILFAYAITFFVFDVVLGTRVG